MKKGLPFVPYYPDFACLCFNCRKQRFDWQLSEIKRLRHNILRLRREIRDPGSYVGFYLTETSDKRQQRLDKLVSDSQIALKAAEENLWKKYNVVVTEADEIEIAREQKEERQAQYRRNFPHTCLRCVLDKSEEDATGFGTQRPKSLMPTLGDLNKKPFGDPPGWDK